MRRLLKNKKGSLLDSAGNTLNGIISIMPPQVKFLLFLFLLVLVSYLLTVLFNVFGVFCNSAQEPVQISPNVIANINLMANTPNFNEIGNEQIDPISIPLLSQVEDAVECANLETPPTSYIILEPDTNSFFVNLGFYQGQEINITQPTWFYGASASACTICQRVRVLDKSGLASRYSACYGDVYRKPEADKTFTQKMFCGCQPPEHYYFDSHAGAYKCIDETCDGITLGQKWDELLSSKGATLLYPTMNEGRDKSSDGLLSISCSQLSPRLATFGIDLFSFPVWVFITLMMILFWAWKHFT